MFSFRPARRARFTKSFATVFKKCCLLFPIWSAEKNNNAKRINFFTFFLRLKQFRRAAKNFKNFMTKVFGKMEFCVCFESWTNSKKVFSWPSNVSPLFFHSLKKSFLRRLWLLKLQGTRWFISPIFTFRRFNENCFSYFSSDCKQSEKFN